MEEKSSNETSGNGELIDINALSNITSPAVQDIISHDPGIIVRWGTGIVFVVLVFFFAITWFIRYPDVVHTTARLSAINSPKPITIREGGKVTSLNFQNGQVVEKGSIIARIENSANTAQVLELEKKIETLKNNMASISGMESFCASNIRFEGDSFTQLGSLQTSYNLFLHTWQTLQEYTHNGVYAKQKQLLLADLKNLHKRKNNLLEQKDLYYEDLDLSKSFIDSIQEVHHKHQMNQADFAELSSRIITKKLSIPKINNSIEENDFMQNDKKRELLSNDEVASSQVLSFKDELIKFSYEIKKWKNDFLIISPAGGKLNYTFFIEDNQQLQPGQTIAYVTPPNSTNYIQLIIPQRNFSEVSIGQKVALKFSSYKWEDYGSVDGVIDYISPIPTDTAGYIARVKLPKGLVTNHNKQIEYREGFVAHAEIITNDKRLFNKFFNLHR